MTAQGVSLPQGVVALSGITPDFVKANESVWKKWKIIYPTYIDCSASIPGGRRVGKSLAIDKPSMPELVSAINQLGYSFIVEDKAYPRDWFMRVRFRVQNLKHKEAFLRDLCSKIRDIRASGTTSKSK